MNDLNITEEEIFKKISELIIEEFSSDIPLSEITKDSRFIDDFGFDSLDYPQLVDIVEEELGEKLEIEIELYVTVEDLYGMPTVGSLCEHIIGLLHSR